LLLAEPEELANSIPAQGKVVPQDQPDAVEGNGQPRVELSAADVEKYAFEAIQGRDKADGIVLGRYIESDVNSYEQVAKDNDCQYYYLEEYDELKAIYGEDAMWEINEKFLEIQVASGRDIYLSTNPNRYLDSKAGTIIDNSTYAKELKVLYDNGYRFKKVEGGLYRAIK
jgi:hypothetical protein